ncbi:broad-complex core protein isoforms 1/2/3/4/5 isoform X3 [Hyalella azteca]|uniref:Broad-complex core protein isoforms 1/2/3/4/5 isoform X3 n=1 Tax=Hyalella azteca TaxID=294128 RepID=A0A8B7NQ38_HYAAZ|nr:broad-complex core protein isoforms 1/2/3/4/5 isoform X3 [Hyalella azteca]
MSLGGLLSLKWNNHCSTFLHILSNLHRKQNYDDATVACDGKLYPVHKLVLSTCSEYFEEMFEKTHGKHPVIVLKDIKKEVFEALLKYMYIGEVNVVQEKLAELINAAECLKIKGLAVPDEEPEQLQLGTRNKSNHLSSYSSNQQNSSGNYLNDEHQSANRSLKNTSSSNFSNKRKDFSNLSNINTPPRKIIRASPNVASKNDLAYDSQSKPIQSSDPQESPSRERRGSLASPLSSRSSLDERPPLPTPTSAPSNEDEEIAAWPMAIKDEPTDEPQSEANEGSGACATEFLDRNNGDCKEDEGGAGSAEDALPALPDPAGGEPSGDSQGAAHKDPSDLIDSKVEVGDIEEAPDDWESSLLNKDDEGQEGEALTSMLSGDDASNAAADTPTPGVRRDTALQLSHACRPSSGRVHLNAPQKTPSFKPSDISYQKKPQSCQAGFSSHPTKLLSALNDRIGPAPRNRGASSTSLFPSFAWSERASDAQINFNRDDTSDSLNNEPHSFGSQGADATNLGFDYLSETYPQDRDRDNPIILSSMCGEEGDSASLGRYSGLHNVVSSHSDDAQLGSYVYSADFDSSSLALSGSTVNRSSSVSLHSCSQCPYTTPSKQNMTRHQLWHTGERPFGCPHCKYRATTKQNAVSHMRRKHPDQLSAPHHVICYQHSNH